MILYLFVIPDFTGPQKQAFCTYPFAPFQRWLQLVVFHLKGDFPSNFVLILIILKWVLYYTVKLLNSHFWTHLGCTFNWYQWNLIYSSHLYEFVICKWLKCTENWTGSPLLHLLPTGDLALSKMAGNVISIYLTTLSWSYSLLLLLSGVL